MAEQVGKFLTELPELETPTDGDLMYIVDDETTSKKVTMANLKRVLGGNVTGTVEGASVSFSDGADGIPMEECEVTIIPIQTGSGTPSPSNVRPISGHSSITVTVASTSGGSGDDTTVSLGRTVYGGTLDVTTGELKVTHGFKTYTGDSSENWIYTSSLNRVYINIADTIRPSTYAEIQSNILHYSLPQEDYGSYLNDQGNLIVYAPSTITSASDWKTWLTSNNIEVVYELATPQTFNLTKAQVKTLLGQNYVSHDGGGNIKVVYIRDLDIVINDLINRVTALENE